jgi:hypothetical protein
MYRFDEAGLFPQKFNLSLCDVDAQGRIWNLATIFSVIHRLDYLNFWPPPNGINPQFGELNINEVKAILHNKWRLVLGWSRIGKI